MNKTYKDIGSGIDFDRNEFQGLLDDVIEHRISRVYITYKDILSRISFDMFKNLFKQFDCEIIPINETEDKIGKINSCTLLIITNVFDKAVSSNSV